MSTPARSVKRLLVTPDAIARLCEDGARFLTSQGVPPGCKVLGSAWDVARDCLSITIEHGSFPLVEEGRMIEILTPPHFRRLP